MREHKQHVFDDVAAAAEWLVADGLTTADRLAISGGSNGGLLVGAAITQRPELYAAAVCSAPLLDMVRYERFGLGATWSDEYGTAADPVELGWLLSYSPYHHVIAGTEYPAVLFTVFDGDSPRRPAPRPQDVCRPAVGDRIRPRGEARPAATGGEGRTRRPLGQPVGRAGRGRTGVARRSARSGAAVGRPAARSVAQRSVESPPRHRYTRSTMSRSLIERRLTDVSKRLKRAREEMAVLDEQLAVLADHADEARIRALVSETPLANKEYHEAQRHTDAMQRSRRVVAASISDLQQAQDELLDRLVIESH